MQAELIQTGSGCGLAWSDWLQVTEERAGHGNPKHCKKVEQKKDRFHLCCKTQKLASTGNACKRVQRDEDYGAGEQDCVYCPRRDLGSTRGHVSEKKQ